MISKEREREIVTHGRTNHTWANPIQRVLSRVLYLLNHKASFSIPLRSYFDNNIWTERTAIDITQIIQTAVFAYSSQFWLIQSDIISRSITAGDTMTLLLA